MNNFNKCNQSFIKAGEYHLTCVGPAQLPGLGVIGQSVGQPQAVLHQHRPVGPVHAGALDLRPVSVPVGPVQVSAGREREREDVSMSQHALLTLLWRHTYPWAGSVMIGRGLMRSLSKRTRRWLPSNRDTSMRSRMESVQYMFLDMWSMAIPSGLPRSARRHTTDTRDVHRRHTNIWTPLYQVTIISFLFIHHMVSQTGARQRADEKIKLITEN